MSRCASLKSWHGRWRCVAKVLNGDLLDFRSITRAATDSHKGFLAKVQQMVADGGGGLLSRRLVSMF